MEIAEVRKLKFETEKAIADLIMEFCKKTGASVRAVELEMIDVSLIGDPAKRHFSINDLRLDVRL